MNFPDKTQNNKAAIFLVGAVGGIGGSALTGLWVISAVWAAALLFLKKIPATLTRSDLLLVVPASAYVGANLLSALANGARLDDFLVLYPLVVFLFPWFVLPRLRYSLPSDLIGIFALGAGFCGLLALPLALYQDVFLGIRSEGGAGNPIPFSMVCALGGQLGLLNTVYRQRLRKLLGWFGYVAAFGCILLSASKGVLPPMLLGPMVLLILFPNVRKDIFNRNGLIAAVVCLLALAALAEPLYSRVLETLSFLTSGTTDSSSAERLLLWRKGAELAIEQPILGYGMQNRYDLIREIGLHYGHFHNGFLTSLIDSGLVGLACTIVLIVSPLIISLMARGIALYRERLFLAIVLVLTYGIGGLTNFIFWHDIYDTLFLWTATIIAASVPVAASNPALGKGKV